LEGGYNLAAIQESAKYHVEALLEIWIVSIKIYI
jgi:hypothetical protein